MDNRQNLYTDYIEDFLSGKLGPGEEEQFKVALESNPELAEAYRFRTSIAKRWNEEEKYRSTRQRVQEIMAETNRSPHFRLKYVYLAASILLLTGISLVLWRAISPDNSINEVAAYADTANEQKNAVSVMEQPEKASLYEFTEELTVNDSLLILRTPLWPETGKLIITLKDRERVKESCIVDASTDSLIIHMNDYRPGTYRWSLDNTAIYGFFTVKENEE